ncbi:hypothetical protein GCG54_00011172 [Colletotrichum gloeosporioides]|uniref:PNPLA domain-containing protein n=1 Tax=Colletotrichum gloeosporioides TaxID=474922 RepID=A0A8H4CS04_COLGL|nr:uncharacterized protein GCG54_00011172 [Colletotrichum gloeosporioides]KAF3808980.1 hypothetical protein GCG54_00011172 [Colletotrichum gloeosporioides]
MSRQSSFPVDLCEKCDEQPCDVTCSCSNKFCEPCFQNKHLKRHPTHRLGGSKRSTAFWAKVSGKNLGMSSPSQRDKCFRDDEASKWFGLHTVVNPSGRVNTIVETKRLSLLMERSMEFYGNSPKRQFPSITSFIGETNAGKSTLVRSLIFQAKKELLDRFGAPEAPVPADDNIETAALSTTGEVNLYPDPATFGSDCPRLFADCEGLFGTEPVASKHQTEWTKHGRCYLVKTKDGSVMDRRTAVKELYPRFLYIFSDVVCYVMRNQKAWADSALKLLDWSMIGAQSTINQQSLPALIIVLNGPFIQNKNWLSGDEDAVTSSFFSAIDPEITENARVRKLAALHGSSTMRQLFEKSFSSVHVHYIPQEGYGDLGTTEIMCQQYSKLAHRVEFDSIRVQNLRQKAWTRFDVRQLNLVTEFAFQHLASGNSAPFDFDKCRKELSIPGSLEENFSSFIRYALEDNPEERLESTTGVLATSILLNSLRVEGRKLISHPDFVFNGDLKSICMKAVDSFLIVYRRCGFVDPQTGDRCVNLRYGHALGHQSRTGAILSDGPFVQGVFDKSLFLELIHSTLRKTMESIDEAKAPSMVRQTSWRTLVAERHKAQLSALRQLQGYPRWDSKSERIANNDTLPKICLGCLFGRVEFVLPCSHQLCVDCLEDFDSTSDDCKYPGNHTHIECVICKASGGPNWPFNIQTRPPLSGLRVLSLDGGGVRGIVELTILKRLEDFVGLDVPIGRFFDLMVGTSAGK